jgi:ankyrin repeat protein
VLVGVDVNAVNGTGETPLHKAVIGGDTDMVEALVAAEANVNARDDFGNTPLHNVASAISLMNKAQIANILMAAGANVNTVNNDGKTPLDIARRSAKG